MRFIQRVYRLVLFSAGVLFLAACSNVNSNSLLTDKMGSVAGVLDKTPSSSQLSITVDSSTMSIESGATQFEITGNCFISTFSNHQITAKLKANSDPLRIMAAKGGGASGICDHGRYNIIVDPNWDLVSGVNEVKIELMATDNSSGTSGSASRLVNIYK